MPKLNQLHIYVRVLKLKPRLYLEVCLFTHVHIYVSREKPEVKKALQQIPNYSFGHLSTPGLNNKTTKIQSDSSYISLSI